MSFEIFAEKINNKLDTELKKLEEAIGSASKAAIIQIAIDFHKQCTPPLNLKLKTQEPLDIFIKFWENQDLTLKNPQDRIPNIAKAFEEITREQRSVTEVGVETNGDDQAQVNRAFTETLQQGLQRLSTICDKLGLDPQIKINFCKRHDDFFKYCIRELQNFDKIENLTHIIKYYCEIIKITINGQDDKKFCEKLLVNFPPDPTALACINGVKNELIERIGSLLIKSKHVVVKTSIDAVLKNIIAQLNVAARFIDNKDNQRARIFAGYEIHTILYLKYVFGLITYEDAKVQDNLFDGDLNLDPHIMKKAIFEYSDNLRKRIIKEARDFCNLIRFELDEELQEHEKINNICKRADKGSHYVMRENSDSEGGVEINYDKLEECCLVYIKDLIENLKNKENVKNSAIDDITDLSLLYTQTGINTVMEEFLTGERFNLAQNILRYSPHETISQDKDKVKKRIEELKISDPKNHRGREISQSTIQKAQNPSLNKAFESLLKNPEKYFEQQDSTNDFFTKALHDKSIIFLPNFREIIKCLSRSKHYKQEIYEANIDIELINSWTLILLEKEDLDTFRSLSKLLVENKNCNSLNVVSQNFLGTIVFRRFKEHIKLKKDNLSHIERKYYDFVDAIYQALIESRSGLIKEQNQDNPQNIMCLEIRNYIIESSKRVIEIPDPKDAIIDLPLLPTCVNHYGEIALDLIAPKLATKRKLNPSIDFHKQHRKNNIIKQALKHKYNNLAKDLTKRHIETRKDDKLLTIIEIIQHLNKDQYQEFNFLYEELTKIVDKDGKKANIIEILAQKYDDAIDFANVIKFIKSQQNSEERFDESSIPGNINYRNFFYSTFSKQNNYFIEILQALYKNDEKDFCQTLYEKIVKNIDSFIKLISISNPNNIISQDFYENYFEKFKEEYFEQDINKIIRLGGSTLRQTMSKGTVGAISYLTIIFKKKIPINDIIHKISAIEGQRLKISLELQSLLKYHLFYLGQGFASQLTNLIKVEPQESKSNIEQQIYLFSCDFLIGKIREILKSKKGQTIQVQLASFKENIKTLNETLEDPTQFTHDALVKKLYGQNKDINNKDLFEKLNDTQIKEFKELLPKSLQYHKRKITQQLIEKISKLTTKSQRTQSKLESDYAKFIENGLIEVNQLTQEQIRSIFDFTISPTPKGDKQQENQRNKELLALSVIYSQISEIESKAKDSPEHHSCLQTLGFTLERLISSSKDLLTLSKKISEKVAKSKRRHSRDLVDDTILIREILDTIYKNSTIDNFAKLIQRIEKGMGSLKGNQNWRREINKELLSLKEEICKNIQDSFKNEEISNEQKIARLENNLDFIIQKIAPAHQDKNTRVIKYFTTIISLISFSEIEKENKQELFKKLEDTVDKLDESLNKSKNEIKTELVRRINFLETRDFNQIKSIEDATSAIDEAKNSQELAAATTEFYYSAEKQSLNYTTETREEIIRKLQSNNFKFLEKILNNFKSIETKEDLQAIHQAIVIAHDCLNLFVSTAEPHTNNPLIYFTLKNQLTQLSNTISKIDDAFKILEKAQFYLNGDIKPFVDQIKELRGEFPEEKPHPDDFLRNNALCTSYLELLNNPFEKIHKKIQEQTTVENSDTLKKIKDEIFSALEEKTSKNPATELPENSVEEKNSTKKRKAEKEGEEEEEQAGPKRLKKVTKKFEELTKEADKKQTARGKRKREEREREQESNKEAKPTNPSPPQRPQSPTDPQAHQPLAEFQPPGRFHR